MLPTGTVTFLFSDIQGSTLLLQKLGDGYARVLSEHQQLLREAFARHGGTVVDTQGDSFFAVFPRALDAVNAAGDAQHALSRHEWGDGIDLRVRMGIHTGEPTLTGGRYVGIDIHRAARIGSAGHGGQVLVSETTQVLVKNDLPAHLTLRDLGEHRLKDLRTPKHLYQLVISDLSADFPPLKTLDATPNNLPVQLTNFIGREREIETVKRMLASARLITLTGSGGSGKTRLSLQVAGEVLEQFRDGVWFVELAPLNEPELVAQAVAHTLHLREQAGEPIRATLTNYLRDKRLLVILDNCEHLIDACAKLADHLLRACPHLKMLASSREPLGIAGETPYRVPSLAIPDPRHLALDTLTQYEAVRLFIDRAVAWQPAFAVNNQNAPAVAQICARLDGIPLALELAAARTKALSVEQIAKKLDDRFRLLTGGSRTALPRQQTLRAAIDWSYDLLTDQERVLLRRLSVFAGGWTLEAAEAVCSEEDGPHLEIGRAPAIVAPDEILDLLTHLVDKSLVVVQEELGEARYSMLETVRQYAAETLLGAGEAEDTRDSHLAFFSRFAVESEPKAFSFGQVLMIHRLEQEHDNLGAALEWGLGRNPASMLRLAGALWRFWFSGGNFTEGRNWLEAALAANDQTPTAARAKALSGAGMMAFAQGDHTAALVLHAESAALYRQVGDMAGSAFSIGNMGVQFYSQGEFTRATPLLEESLALARQVNDKRLVALALNGLGEIARYQADNGQARALYQESLALARQEGDIERILEPLFNLGAVAHQQGDDDLARSLFREGLLLSRKVGDKRLLAANLGGMAGVWGTQSEAERAGHLFGAAERAREDIEYELERVDRVAYDADVAAVHAALGKDAFEKAWAEGRALTMEQAIELATT